VWLVRRRPLRVLGIALVFILFVLGGLVVGVQISAEFHYRKARIAVAKNHNSEAEKHLKFCIAASPRHAPALLLTARTARRQGALELATEFLNQYESVRGPNDESLVLERVLLQVDNGQFAQVRDYCYGRIDEKHPDSGLILESLINNFIRGYQLDDA